MRNEILIAQAKSQEISLAAFDRSLQQVQQLSKLVQAKDDEIKKLTELCKKNKIEIKPTPSP